MPFDFARSAPLRPKAKCAKDVSSRFAIPAYITRGSPLEW